MCNTNIKKMNNIILVSGHSGSGKSTFAKMLAESLSYKYINVDNFCFKCCHSQEFLNIAQQEIDEYLYDENNELRKNFEIGCQVLYKRDSQAKNSARYFFDYIQQEIISRANEPCVVEWFGLPLLDIWESNAVKVLVEISDDETRIQRLLSRGKISAEMLKEREKAGVDYSKYKFDAIIKNDGNFDDLTQSVEDFVLFLKGEM
jgi:dephospho-CoA kinase